MDVRFEVRFPSGAETSAADKISLTYISQTRLEIVSNARLPVGARSVAPVPTTGQRVQRRHRRTSTVAPPVSPLPYTRREPPRPPRPPRRRTAAPTITAASRMVDVGGYTAPTARFSSLTCDANDLAAARNMASVTDDAPEASEPRATPGKMNALLAKPGANVALVFHGREERSAREHRLALGPLVRLRRRALRL